MTPSEFSAWVGGGTAALVTITRVASWLLKNIAAKQAERRAEANKGVEDRDNIIADLRKELAQEREECDTKRRAAETRADQAERDRAQMEGLLYRMGWERGPAGGWKRNGHGEGEKKS